MSKVDQMRALREAKFSQQGTRVPRPAIKPVPKPAPVQAPPVPAPTTPAVTPEAPAVPSTSAQATISPVQGPGREHAHGVTPGKPISAYKTADLVAVVQWVARDGAQRTPDEIVDAVMSELGFVRKGKNIREALTTAISEAGVPLAA